MNITMGQVLALNTEQPTFEKLCLPIRTSYKLAKLFAAADKEVSFYKKKMQEIIMLFSVKDDKGNPVYAEDGSYVKVLPEKMPECQNEIHQLNTLEIEMPNITFILDDFGEVNLSTESLRAILPFIQE